MPSAQHARRLQNSGAQLRRNTSQAQPVGRNYNTLFYNSNLYKGAVNEFAKIKGIPRQNAQKHARHMFQTIGNPVIARQQGNKKYNKFKKSRDILAALLKNNT